MIGPATPQELAPLSQLFREAGYTEEGLLALLGPVSLPQRLGRERAHLLYLTREGKRLDTLVRLFLLGFTTPREAAEAALGPELLESCGRWGLLEAHRETVAPRVRLAPFRGLLLAVDQPHDPEIEGRADQVMGITSSTVVLANFTVRRPVRRALDLGTGCGVQALLAAPHSEEVIATDCNPRALEFARFNAALNNCEKICLRQGDLFEPVRGARFDLIVMNPPFAISPGQRYLYRDSGEPGDRFCQRLVREAPAFLKEGGFLQMTLDWAERAGEDWRQRLAAWFEGSGCDAWVLRLQREPAPSYAWMWVRDTEPGGPQQAGRVYEEWVQYFEREHIEAVSTGLITMRRRSGRNWTQIDEAPGEPDPHGGEWVALAFAQRDYLEGARDETLLAARLRVAADVRLVEEAEARQGRWQPAAARIRLARGIPWEGRVDARIKNLLARMDGRHVLRDLLVHLAVELGVAPDMLIPQALPLVRDLILRGFLLPEVAATAGD
ncbi:MAG: methyltransferase [Bryobacteraceae bacterium]